MTQVQDRAPHGVLRRELGDGYWITVIAVARRWSL
jgi:hypothetical protein